MQVVFMTHREVRTFLAKNSRHGSSLPPSNSELKGGMGGH